MAGWQLDLPRWGANSAVVILCYRLRCQDVRSGRVHAGLEDLLSYFSRAKGVPSHVKHVVRVLVPIRNFVVIVVNGSKEITSMSGVVMHVPIHMASRLLEGDGESPRVPEVLLHISYYTLGKVCAAVAFIAQTKDADKAIFGYKARMDLLGDTEVLVPVSEGLGALADGHAVAVDCALNGMLFRVPQIKVLEALLALHVLAAVAGNPNLSVRDRPSAPRDGIRTQDPGGGHANVDVELQKLRWIADLYRDGEAMAKGGFVKPESKGSILLEEVGNRIDQVGALVNAHTNIIGKLFIAAGRDRVDGKDRADSRNYTDERGTTHLEVVIERMTWFILSISFCM